MQFYQLSLTLEASVRYPCCLNEVAINATVCQETCWIKSNSAMSSLPSIPQKEKCWCRSTRRPSRMKGFKTSPSLLIHPIPNEGYKRVHLRGTISNICMHVIRPLRNSRLAAEHLSVLRPTTTKTFHL